MVVMVLVHVLQCSLLIGWMRCRLLMQDSACFGKSTDNHRKFLDTIEQMERVKATLLRAIYIAENYGDDTKFEDLFGAFGWLEENFKLWESPAQITEPMQLFRSRYSLGSQGADRCVAASRELRKNLLPLFDGIVNGTGCDSDQTKAVSDLVQKCSMTVQHLAVWTSSPDAESQGAELSVPLTRILVGSEQCMALKTPVHATNHAFLGKVVRDAQKLADEANAEELYTWIAQDTPNQIQYADAIRERISSVSSHVLKLMTVEVDRYIDPVAKAQTKLSGYLITDTSITGMEYCKQFDQLGCKKAYDDIKTKLKAARSAITHIVSKEAADAGLKSAEEVFQKARAAVNANAMYLLLDRPSVSHLTLGKTLRDDLRKLWNQCEANNLQNILPESIANRVPEVLLSRLRLVMSFVSKLL